MYKSRSGKVASRQEWIEHFAYQFSMLPDQAENYFLAQIDTKNIVEV
jgi:hypothetical protein